MRPAAGPCERPRSQSASLRSAPRGATYGARNSEPCVSMERISLPPERNEARLAAFARAHDDKAAGEVGVGQIERDELGASQAGRIEQLEDGAVADEDRDE